MALIKCALYEGKVAGSWVEANSLVEFGLGTHQRLLGLQVDILEMD